MSALDLYQHSSISTQLNFYRQHLYTFSEVLRPERLFIAAVKQVITGTNIKCNHKEIKPFNKYVTNSWPCDVVKERSLFLM